jgi:hypothetical protein
VARVELYPVGLHPGWLKQIARHSRDALGGSPMTRPLIISLAVFAALAAALILAASAGASPVPAPLLQAGAPPVVSYQGRVVVSGTPYTGTGYLKFAVVNQAGSSSYWSNDGTSTNGSEPGASVALSVTGGLFNVLLGDTTLPGMTRALTPTVFSGVDRALRVWFASSGAGPFTRLSPDRRIAAVPYALQAEEANYAVTAGNVLYSPAKTDYYSLPGEAFLPWTNVGYSNSGDGGAYIQYGAGALSAPVHLPHGATVTQFTAFVWDGSDSEGTDITVALKRLVGQTGTYLDMASVSSTGAPGNASLIDTSISSAVIDNSTGGYLVEAYSDLWDYGILGITGVSIRYTIGSGH